MYHGDDEDDQAPRGLLHNATSAATSVVYNVGRHWSKKIYDSLQRSRDPKAYYNHLLKAATNYEQWSEAAVIMDRLQGKDAWKNNPVSAHYDYELLQERLAQLTAARHSGDLGSMIFLLRTSLARNLGNVGRPELYDKTIIGTKRLIEDYNSEVIRQLNIICDTESDDFPMAAKLEFFTHTRQAFGRTALLLSGGATMGLIHIGVIKSLYENQLLPRIISGSSCGSIIAAVLCTCVDEEIPSMFQFDKFHFTVFTPEEEKGDYLARVLHFLKHGALFDNGVLKEALKENIGNVTFQEAYNRTRRVLNITVSTSGTFEMPRLLNYLTAPNVLIWSAVDLPMNKLSELFNVNHSIVCQVNPYVVPFLQNALARSPANRVLGWMFHQAKSEIQHRLNQLSILGVTPRLIHKTQAIMAQRYDGDITIVPHLDFNDYINIVSNPSPEHIMDATLKGERATWPRISIIKNHCSVEHCIDDILYRLRLRRLEAFRAYPSMTSAGATSTTASSKARATTTTTGAATATTSTTFNGCDDQSTNGQREGAQHPPLKNSTSASVVPTRTLRGSVSTSNFHSMRANSSPTSPTKILVTPPALEMSRLDILASSSPSVDNHHLPHQDKSEGNPPPTAAKQQQQQQSSESQSVAEDEETKKSINGSKKATMAASASSTPAAVTVTTTGTSVRRNSSSSMNISSWNTGSSSSTTKTRLKSGSVGSVSKGSSAAVVAGGSGAESPAAAAAATMTTATISSSSSPSPSSSLNVSGNGGVGAGSTVTRTSAYNGGSTTTTTTSGARGKRSRAFQMTSIG
ncbi:hypothetical protein DFQ27_009118 [Actinomortierella ambigua]|uniref:Patatin-like phospholipase domain-containing protein n=1 Tax=Actinomortierella ambigua TaxID=1343610 RepID=A0A9P6PQM8_9FUNG|nr:hypothetical protein DFQ27_009118 [Actinomortierella ambigua]